MVFQCVPRVHGEITVPRPVAVWRLTRRAVTPSTGCVPVRRAGVVGPVTLTSMSATPPRYTTVLLTRSARIQMDLSIVSVT